MRLPAHYDHLESIQKIPMHSSLPTRKPIKSKSLVVGTQTIDWYFCNSSLSVLVQAAVTKYHKQQKFISHSSGDWNSEVRVPSMVRFWWEPSSRLQTAVFLYPLMRKKSELPLWLCLIRALIPLIRAPLTWFNYLPNSPPPSIIILGLGFQHMSVGGTWTFSP